MKDFIIKLLDLKPEDIKNMDIVDIQNITHITITLNQHPHRCPRCFKYTDKIKEYKNKVYVHQIVRNRDTYIYYNARRYICPYCRKTFNEDNPFDKKYSSITNATLINILDDLKHYTATYTHIAQKYNISPTTVMNIFDNHVQIPRHKLQDIVCIDEFYFNRHSKYKYAFIIVGFRNKLIIDIVESRWQTSLSDYFFSIGYEERKIVKYVCMDMYINYKNIVNIYFPDAIICIDSFHVLKRINDSLNTLRKRICRRYDHDSREYKLLKYRYRLLLKNGEYINNHSYYFDKILGYTTNESGVLECILSIDDDLRRAYKLKEDYRFFNSVKEEEFRSQEYLQVFDTLIESFLFSEIKEMVEAGKTLRNWREEIFNSFIWIDGRRISNGCIEGKNNYIKKILSNANGMKNFDRARNRIMYSQNLHERYSISVKNKIKK